jgi:hypothetical protein
MPLILGTGSVLETAGNVCKSMHPRVQLTVHFSSLIFASYSPTLGFMFQGPSSQRDFVVRCKRCGENVPAMIETLPASWIAVNCPLCSEHRRYLPTEVFQGRVSWQLDKRHVRSGQGGAR